MSALLLIGEAQHKLLNAEAEIRAHVVAPETVLGEDEAALNQALLRARTELFSARSALGALQFALRTQALAAVLSYHEAMAEQLREASLLARMQTGRGLHLQAERHAAWAKALRVLIGPAASAATTATATTAEGGGR